jgi:hypothetical protein
MAGSSLKPHSSLYSLARTLAERLFDLQEAGRIMHESWTVTKRSQGFHAPSEHCDSTYRDLISQGMFNADQVDSLGWKAKKPPCELGLVESREEHPTVDTILRAKRKL